MLPPIFGTKRSFVNQQEAFSSHTVLERLGESRSPRIGKTSFNEINDIISELCDAPLSENYTLWATASRSIKHAVLYLAVSGGNHKLRYGWEHSKLKEELMVLFKSFK